MIVVILIDYHYDIHSIFLHTRRMPLFIRTERSIKEFIRAYPIVSTLVIIHFLLWIFVYVIPIEIKGLSLFQWGAGHNYMIHEYGEYWRFITPIFLHGDLMHALFNSFSLVLFGPALEQMLGKTKFIAAYLIAGLIGNIGTYAVNPMDMIPHIGASGAIYGLFGLYMFMVVFRKHLIDAGNAQIVTIIFFIGLVMTFMNPGINIYAHIFGFIGGFALGNFTLSGAEPFSIYRNPRKSISSSSPQFDPNRWNKKRIPRKVKANILWIVIAILVLAGIFGRFF